MKGMLEVNQWGFKQKALSKAVATCFAASLLSGCFDGGGSSSSNPVAPATSSTIEEVTSKTVATNQVAATVLVPSATVVKTVADNGFGFGVDDFLLALKGLIPEALALEEGDLTQVSGDKINILDIDLLIFIKDQGYKPFVIDESLKSEAFAIDSEGNITIDLVALVAADVTTEPEPGTEPVAIQATLDTALVMQVKVTVEIDGQPDVEVTMRSPLVNDALDVSPVSEFVVRVIESDVDADLSNLNITEVRNLLSAAFEVSVAGSSSVQNPNDLIAGLEETAGAQIGEQFEGYRAEEPVDETITAANGTFNVLIFEQALDATTPEAGFTFGSEQHLVERASVTLNLDSGGNGTVRFNADDPNQVGAEAEIRFEGGISLLTESFSGDESSTGSAELHGNGNILLKFPGAQEFDNSEEGLPPLWIISDPLNLTLRSMGLAVGGQGRIGVGFGTEDEFGDANGAPDFDSHNTHQNFVPFILALPQSSVGAADFTRDMGVIFIDSVVESTGSSSFSLGYAVGNELITATGTPGEFSGGTNESFGIDRNEFGATFFSESNVNSDTLTFQNFSNGTFETVSTEGGVSEQAGFGIAAPDGSLIGNIALEVECRNDSTLETRFEAGTLNCNDGETPIGADTTLFIGVPVAATPSLQQGDLYRFVTYQFDPQGGVLACRGDLTVDDVATTQVLTYSNQKCTSVGRVGEPDTSVSAISPFTPADLTLSYTFNGRVLEHVSNTEIRGFVSDDQNIIVTRYADPSNPTYVGITIASRVVDNSAP